MTSNYLGSPLIELLAESGLSVVHACLPSAWTAQLDGSALVADIPISK